MSMELFQDSQVTHAWMPNNNSQTFPLIGVCTSSFLASTNYLHSIYSYSSSAASLLVVIGSKTELRYKLNLLLLTHKVLNTLQTPDTCLYRHQLMMSLSRILRLILCLGDLSSHLVDWCPYTQKTSCGRRIIQLGTS